MKVLVVGAHPDDESYGPGATISMKTRVKGWDVRIITFTDGCNVPSDDPQAIASQLHRACKILGASSNKQYLLKDQQLDDIPLITLTKKIEEEIEFFEPQLILTHSAKDLNRDHRLVAEATLVACRPKPDSCIREIWSYEVPSSTNWAGGQFGSFEPNIFVELDTESIVHQKDAIYCYINELEDLPHARSIEAIHINRYYRGRSVGFYAAEAFELVRRIN